MVLVGFIISCGFICCHTCRFSVEILLLLVLIIFICHFFPCFTRSFSFSLLSFYFVSMLFHMYCNPEMTFWNNQYLVALKRQTAVQKARHGFLIFYFYKLCCIEMELWFARDISQMFLISSQPKSFPIIPVNIFGSNGWKTV